MEQKPSPPPAEELRTVDERDTAEVEGCKSVITATTPTELGSMQHTLAAAATSPGGESVGQAIVEAALELGNSSMPFQDVTSSSRPVSPKSGIAIFYCPNYNCLTQPLESKGDTDSVASKKATDGT